MRYLDSKYIQRILRELRETSSTNQKVAILQRAHEEQLAPVLRWAYNPFWNYYIRDLQESEIGKSDHHVLSSETFKLLRALRERKFTGNDARARLIAHMRTLNESSQEILFYILRRDVRAGINVKLINEAYPGTVPEHKVMLAQKVNWARASFPLYSSVKLDGVRALYNEGSFYFRSGKPIYGLEWLGSRLSKLGSSTLDGELLIPGISFQESSGIIRSDSVVPDTVRFCVFDMPDEGGSFDHRLGKIRAIPHNNVKAVPHIRVRSRAEALAHYGHCRSKGFEGTVLKPIDYRYVGKRSNDWMKLKAIESLDLKVIDYFEGTGKYVGMLGGFIVDFEGMPVRVGSGFSDQDRGAYWDTRNHWIGQTMEILYQEKTPTGSLRHPRFVQWRTDK